MAYSITLTINNSTPIPVESYAFAVNVPTTTTTGGGTGTAKPQFTALQINKALDANSPLLYNDAAIDSLLKKVELSLTPAGSDQPAAQYILTNARITGVADSGSAHSGPFPTEEVSFAFSRIEIKVDGNIFSYDAAGKGA